MNFSFFDNKNSFYLVKMYSNHKEKKKNTWIHSEIENNQQDLMVKMMLF